ncbi:hypothetical protein D9C73_014732 [Collichthys lucidus]|uniref:Uncharacterized protein n=1 Tax=Collichthys lucidus TaxID=240159 RepID=A0A4U5V0L2_COLLU|nr:hypothetical protein D9C73_014732 [Collichthys lucidus]
MARAETIENVGETGGGANGPLSRHNTCRMELPRPFPNWPGLITTTTITTGSGAGTGAMHLHHNHHHLHPFQAIYMSYPLPYPLSESHDEAQTHQQLPALSPSLTPPPSPLCNQREERDGSFSGEQSVTCIFKGSVVIFLAKQMLWLPGVPVSVATRVVVATGAQLSAGDRDSDREEHQEACSRQGPLPDLLPQNEHPSWVSTHHRALREEAVQEMEVRRVANQLRAIGDEFEATVLRRAHVAPHWQEWRDACRGLLNFITQTLSTLYRLT